MNGLPTVASGVPVNETSDLALDPTDQEFCSLNLRFERVKPNKRQIGIMLSRNTLAGLNVVLSCPLNEWMHYNLDCGVRLSLRTERTGFFPEMNSFKARRAAMRAICSLL